VRRHLRLKRQERTIRKLYEEPVIRKGISDKPEAGGEAVSSAGPPDRMAFYLIIKVSSRSTSPNVIDQEHLICDANHTIETKPSRMVITSKATQTGHSFN